VLAAALTERSRASPIARRTRVIAIDRKLDEVNESITDVLAGTVPARVVFEFWPVPPRRKLTI
jgi:hypothetical protein